MSGCLLGKKEHHYPQKISPIHFHSAIPTLILLKIHNVITAVFCLCFQGFNLSQMWLCHLTGLLYPLLGLFFVCSLLRQAGPHVWVTDTGVKTLLIQLRPTFWRQATRFSLCVILASNMSPSLGEGVTLIIYC